MTESSLDAMLRNVGDFMASIFGGKVEGDTLPADFLPEAAADPTSVEWQKRFSKHGAGEETKMNKIIF